MWGRNTGTRGSLRLLSLVLTETSSVGPRRTRGLEPYRTPFNSNILRNSGISLHRGSSTGRVRDPGGSGRRTRWTRTSLDRGPPGPTRSSPRGRRVDRSNPPRPESSLPPPRPWHLGRSEGPGSRGQSQMTGRYKPVSQ